MIESPLEHRQGAVTDAQARRTVFVVAGVLLLVAAWNVYRGRAANVYVFGGPALALLLAGLLLPPAARGFHHFWMGVGAVLGYVNSRVLLGLIFYGLVAPYGFVSRRVARRDPLLRRRGRRESYWVPRKATRQTREGFERLF